MVAQIGCKRLSFSDGRVSSTERVFAAGPISLSDDSTAVAVLRSAQFCGCPSDRINVMVNDAVYRRMRAEPTVKERT